MSTISSTETGSGPYPLLQAVWDYGFLDPAVQCSAMWCGGVLEVSSSPLEGELTGSCWHLCYRPYAQCAQKGSGRRDLTIAVSLGCPVSLQTSSFRTKWCHLIPSTIRRHLIKSIDLRCICLRDCPAIGPILEDRQNACVVQLQLRWRWDMWPPNLVV